MIQSFEELRSMERGAWIPTVVVAGAEDSYVLESIRKAKDLGMANAILLGETEEVKRIAEQNGIDISDFELVQCAGQEHSCPAAVGIIREGGAQVLMKGLTHTATMLKAILSRENGLRSGELISHVGIFDVPGLDRLLYVTDAGLNIAPDVDQKEGIIRNAITVANAMGNYDPVVACVCALEHVNPRMPATLDAAELYDRNQRGVLTGCRVAGPTALDNAISVVAAQHKHITMDHIGLGEILLAPNIEAGNILYKSLVFITKARSAGTLIGAKVPVVMTSRADDDDTKLNSIALAIRVALERRKAK